MAGRGRGRGPPGKSNISFTQDQLNAMGITTAAMRAEMQAGTVVPPPIFPPLLNKAGPLTIDVKEQYLLMVKRDMTEFLRESSVSQSSNKSTNESIVRYSNRYAEILNEGPQNIFVWNHLPTELRPNVKRKASGKTSQARKKTKVIDIDTRLKLLEQRELKGDKVTETEEAETKDDEEIDENAEQDETDQPDEEMDMGTDYVNDYFDNGEAFEDEDDNLDEPCF